MQRIAASVETAIYQIISIMFSFLVAFDRISTALHVYLSRRKIEYITILRCVYHMMRLGLESANGISCEVRLEIERTYSTLNHDGASSYLLRTFANYERR